MTDAQQCLTAQTDLTLTKRLGLRRFSRHGRLLSWVFDERAMDLQAISITQRRRMERLTCGKTPPPAIVARMRESSSSSPRIASCKCLGVIRLTLKSLEAFPVNREFAELHSAESETRLTCQFEHFSSKVLQNGSAVDSGFGTDTHLVLCASFQVTMNTTDWELCSAKRSNQKGSEGLF